MINLILDVLIKCHEWALGCFICQVGERGNRMALSNSSNNIFSDETETEKAPPSIDLDVVPNESFARIGLITSNDTWRKKSAMADDVSQGNIPHIDQWLRCASSISTA